MRLQRLNPQTDEAIYRTLWEWNQATPASYRASDDAWGVDDWEEFYEREKNENLIDCAVFDEAGELHGSITVIQTSPKQWEVFVIGRRSSDADCLTTGAFVMAKDLMDAGLAEIFHSWVWEKNRGALKLNRSAGMEETGIQICRGAYKGRPLRFLHLTMDKKRVAKLYGEIEKQNRAAV